MRSVCDSVHRPGGSVRGVSVPGALSRGVSVQGVSVQGVSVQVVSVRGSLSGAISVKGGVSVQGGLWGVSVGGLSLGSFCLRGSLLGRPPCTYVQVVRILLECILVYLKFSQSFLSLSQCLYFYKNQSQYDFDSSLTLLLGNHPIDPPLVHKPK